MMDSNVQNQPIDNEIQTEIENQIDVDNESVIEEEITPMDLALAICSVLYERKAEKIVILKIGEISDMTDIFVVANAVSPMHLRALVDELRDILRDNGVKPAHLEGGRGSKWILLDFIDVVVHMFLPQAREYYALEKYWGDAEMIEYKGNEEL